MSHLKQHEWFHKAQSLLDDQLRVKILRCSDPSMWYKNLVGQSIQIEAMDLDGMWAREGGAYNCLNVIRPEDVMP